MVVLAAIGFLARPGTGASVQAQVGLGTVGAFAVLGGQTVTNTGPSVLNGDLGVSPGTAITGFPPGVANGVTHAADAVAAQAQSDLTIAYNDAAGRAPDANLSGQDLGGKTLTAGAYKFDAAAQLTGTLTLDGQGNPDAVFVFQIGSTLTTATSATVALQNLAQACHVFWQVGSSATLGTNTTFVGNVLALTSITAVTGTKVLDGRLLARNGAVTLDNNVVTRSTCAPASTTSTAGSGGGATTSTTAGSGGGATTSTTAGSGGGATTSTTAGSGGTTSTTTAGGGGATTSTTAGTGGAATTTTSVIAAAQATSTTSIGATSGVTTTTLAGTSGRTGAAADLSPDTSSAGTGATGTGAGGALGGGADTTVTTPVLARTGGRSPVVSLALGLLLLAAGAALRTASGARASGTE